MRVTLITTGRTERAGLAAALHALFPGHDFETMDDVPGRPFHGFTSARLPLPQADLRSAIDKIVRSAGSGQTASQAPHR